MFVPKYGGRKFPRSFGKNFVDCTVSKLWKQQFKYIGPCKSENLSHWVMLNPVAYVERQCTVFIPIPILTFWPFVSYCWVHFVGLLETQRRGRWNIQRDSKRWTQTAYLLKLVIPKTNALPRWMMNVETKTKRTLYSSRRLSFNELTNAKNLVLHSSHFALNWRCCTAAR